MTLYSTYMHGQLKWSTPQRNVLSIDSEPHQPHWVWSWMDRWMAVHAWENHNLDCLKAGCLLSAKSLAVRTKHVDKHGWCGPQGWLETFNKETWSKTSFGIPTSAQWEGWTHSSVPSTSTKASCPHNCWFPHAEPCIFWEGCIRRAVTNHTCSRCSPDATLVCRFILFHQLWMRTLCYHHHLQICRFVHFCLLD